MKQLKIPALVLALIFVSWSLSAHKEGQARIDSLIQEIPHAKNDTQRANLTASVSLLLQAFNPDEGIKYGEQSLAIATNLNWKKGMAIAHSNIAANYNAKSDLPKMLDNLFISLKLEEEIKDSAGIASSLNNIGIVFDNKGEYEKSLEYFTRALKLQQARGNKSAVAIAMGNIGTIYFHQKNYPKVLEVIGEAMVICEEIDDKSGIVSYLQMTFTEHWNTILKRLRSQKIWLMTTLLPFAWGLSVSFISTLLPTIASTINQTA
jgi:tetratricopeptide (TPR) repeat protein